MPQAHVILLQPSDLMNFFLHFGQVLIFASLRASSIRRRPCSWLFFWTTSSHRRGMWAALPHFRHEAKWQPSTGHRKMFCISGTSAWYPHLGHMARFCPSPACSIWALACISEYFCQVFSGRIFCRSSSRNPELHPLPSQHLISKAGFLVALSMPRFPDPKTWLSTYCTIQSLQNKCPLSLHGTHSDLATSSKQQLHLTADPFSRAILFAALHLKRS
mmetsp:Transcript_49879/g.102734  ORF Transcript_49879/g.102734 Transcript_49879/m.102734 type:complete len:217 (-) Transcript_49879:116-766(-)